jgi:hypothetical protein
MQTPESHDPSPGRLRRAVGVSGSYGALAVFGMVRMWAGGPTRTVQMAGGDLATYLWGLRWVPFAIAHGHSPFHTDLMNVPTGVNLLNNTGSMLLGVVASPVTLVFGPAVSFNALTTLAFAVSAAACYVLLRRWTTWWPAAFVGGLLYGFSPYMVSAGRVYLHLIFVPWLPLIVLCLDELLVRQKGSSRRWGLALGLLVIAQFFTAAEVLALTAELVLVGLVVLAVSYREQVRPRIRRAAPGLLTGAAVAIVGLTYPAWYTLYGPGHVRITAPTQLYSADLLGPLVPTSNQLITTAGLRSLGDRLCGFVIPFMGNSFQLTATAYLGVPLLLVLAVFVVRYRRVARVPFFAVIGLVAFVASLGPTLKVGGHVTGIPLPGRILERLPIVDVVFPFRYGLFVVLAAAIVLAIGLDHLRRERDERQVRLSPTVTCGLVAVAALGLLLPAWPYTSQRITTPAFFRPASANVPAGSVVVTYPFPGPHSAETMIWQANNDMHYKMAGGYTYVPTSGGEGWTLLANPSLTRDLLDELLYDQPRTPLTPELRERVLGDLHRWRARTVVVVQRAPRAAEAVRLFTAILGAPPSTGQGVAVWSDVPAGATADSE